MAGKKETLLCILEILKKYSDSEHLMTPKDIKSKLKKIYELEVKDSRTIWDDIEILRELYHYDIPKYGEKGDGYCYIKSADRDLAVTQVQLLTDAINAFPFVSEDETEEICKILWEQLNIYERDLIKYLPVSKPNVKTTEIDLAGTMEDLSKAIKEKVKVNFEYYQYGTDKKLHKREKASGKDHYHVNPYGLIYSGDHYYLACTFYNQEKPSTDIKLFRVDLIKNVTLSQWPIDEVDNPVFYQEAVKYVIDGYLGKVVTITMTISENDIGHVIYKFGKDITVLGTENGRCTVRLRTSKDGFMFWALDRVEDVEVLEPAELRREIIEKLKKNRYGV